MTCLKSPTRNFGSGKLATKTAFENVIFLQYILNKMLK